MAAGMLTFEDLKREIAAGTITISEKMICTSCALWTYRTLISSCAFIANCSFITGRTFITS